MVGTDEPAPAPLQSRLLVQHRALQIGVVALAGAAIAFLLRSAVIGVLDDPGFTGAVKALFAGEGVDKPQALF